MRVPNAVHQAHPWVISRVAPDFALLDVWALPVEGAAGDFADFLALGGRIDPGAGSSRLSHALFWLRFRLGELFGWDDPDRTYPIPGCTETSLRERLPEQLRATAAGLALGEAMRGAAGGFRPLYRTSEEAAAEISNATVHGVLHLSWVVQADGRHRAHMAVYVKPRGWAGRLYLRLIDPFRHLIVYPALLRHVGRLWDERDRRQAS